MLIYGPFRLKIKEVYMLAKRLILLQLALGAVLSACGSSSDPVAPPPPIVTPPAILQGVSGTVVIGNAGEALTGARVQALDGSGAVVATAQTDAQGQYSLSLPEGTYTILSPGQTLTSSVNQGGTGSVPFASSQVKGVNVLSKTFTQLNLIQLPASAGSNATTPPTIGITGLNPVLDAAGTAEFDDDVTTAGGNSLTYLVASLGQGPVLYRLGRNNRKVLFVGGKAGETAPSLEVKQHESLDLNHYAAGLSGPTSLYVTAVDSNNNRSVYMSPVTLTNMLPGAALNDTVQNVDVTALTVANTRIQSLSAPSGASGALVYTTLTWSPYPFLAVKTAAPTQGYHVYRSLNGGAQTLVSTLGAYSTTDAKGKTTLVNPAAWQDADPALAPGVKASYTVRAFSGTFETADSAAAVTTVLPVLKVKLTAPSELATGVSVTPTFSWQTNGVGAYEYFVPALSDTLHGAGISSCGVLPVAQPASGLVDLLQQATLTSSRGFGFSGTLCGVVGGVPATAYTSSYTFDYHPGSVDSLPGGDPGALIAPLQEGRSYQWRLLEAVAVDDPASPHAVSVSFDAAGLLFTYNLYNGLYTFDGDQVYTFTTGGTK
jgi:hypothetical protein